MPKLFGVKIADAHDDFWRRTIDVARELGDIQTETAVLGIVSLVALFGLKRAIPQLPGPLIVLGVAMLAVAALGLMDDGVAVVGEPDGALFDFGLPSGIDFGQGISGELLINTTPTSQTFTLGGNPLTLPAGPYVKVTTVITGASILGNTLSGTFSFERWKSILRKLDLMYFDLKIMDEALHARHLGRGYRTIARNAELLVEHGLQVLEGHFKRVRRDLHPGIRSQLNNQISLPFVVGFRAWSDPDEPGEIGPVVASLDRQFVLNRHHRLGRPFGHDSIRATDQMQRELAARQLLRDVGAKVGPLDELQREVVRAVDNAKVEHPSDVPVMQEGGKPRFAKEHLHEVFVANKRRQDPLQTNTLLEVTGPTSNREKRLGHAAHTEPFAQLIVTKTFGGRRGHERSKVP